MTSPEFIATYRVQLHPDFTFEDATNIVEYLSLLGVSHIYCSPYLQAAEDSTHGYDIVDHSKINEQLGGEKEHHKFCQSLESAGLGQVIDFVPNHMAIVGHQNPWWWDVLQNGPSSYYARYFDVDWDDTDDRWPNKILLPILGDHYGRELESGKLRLKSTGGSFRITYFDHTFPVDPSSLVDLLGSAAAACGSENLAFIEDCLSRLPQPTATAKSIVEVRHRDKAVLENLLERVLNEEIGVQKAIEEQVLALNNDPDSLDRLIDKQNYRLAFWRTATRDLGYRRFFDINSLVGLRVENLKVFEDIHSLPFQWVEKGMVQGLRIDHPDGLRDPTEYFRRLRSSFPDAWIVAEKILERDESIPKDWPVDGTTGYDFLNIVGGLFVDKKNSEKMTDVYRCFIDDQEEVADFHCVVKDSKQLILNQLLASEVNRISNLLVKICERHRRHRDYTRHEMREAVREIAVHFPVYRSYISVGDDKVRRSDVDCIEKAVHAAKTARDDIDDELFYFLKRILLLEIDGDLENDFAIRFQQLTGAVMAKGVEDTAFYRYHRLVSINEVGGDPATFGVSPEEFHKYCKRTQADWPKTMLTLTTHDTKRSEDVRARLSLLSEIPEQWFDAVKQWAQLNVTISTKYQLDRNTEYLIYQTLVGAWPISTQRISEYITKAVREAKVHTSWNDQNEEYERNLVSFVEAVFGNESFLASFENFVETLIEPGRINSLSQTLIKLTAPGIPDIYQGTELWDLSLVDPDNRRPVDFERRLEFLKNADSLDTDGILSYMNEGLPKLWLIRQALRVRRDFPETFAEHGTYQALFAHGQKASHVLAYVRSEKTITVIPRLVLSISGAWGDTNLLLPSGQWIDVLSNQLFEGGLVFVSDLLQKFPVALLVNEKAGI